MSTVVKSYWKPLQSGLHPSRNAQTLLRICASNLVRSSKPSWQTPVQSQIRRTTSRKPQATSAFLLPGQHPQCFHRAFHHSPFHLARRSSQARNAGGDEAKNLSNNVKETFALPQRRINIIFRKRLSQDDGNELLSELQKHRLRGTPDAMVDSGPDAVASGLQYLRARYPMDEDAAIIARVDQELDHQFRAPQTNVDYSPHGQSKIMRIREENEQRFDREEKRRKAEEENEKLTSPASVGSRELVAAPRTFRNLAHGKERTGEEAEWAKEYRRKATMTEVATMSTFARLFPSGVFTVGVVLLSLWLAQDYIPPGQRARIFPDTPPAAATLLGLVATNFAVFVLWRWPPMWSFMNKYFIIVPLRPRAVSMFLAEFSHQQVPHLMINMAVMWFVGARRKPAASLIIERASLTCSQCTTKLGVDSFLPLSSLPPSSLHMLHCQLLRCQTSGR